MSQLKDCLRQRLRDKGESIGAMLLLEAEIRVVRAPEIGCMPSLPEYILQIDTPAAAYSELARLSEAEQQDWLESFAPCLRAENPEWNVVEIDFARLE